MKPVSKFATLIFASILLFGCTGLERGIDPVSTAKSIEGIQEFLNEHPNAKIVTQYLTRDQTVELLQEYPECKYTEPQPIYFVTFKDAQTYVAALVSMDQTPLCTITTTNAETNPIPPIGTVVNQPTPTVPPIVTPPSATVTPPPQSTPPALPTDIADPTPPASLPTPTVPPISQTTSRLWTGTLRDLPGDVTLCNVGELAAGIGSNGNLQCGTLAPGISNAYSSISHENACNNNQFVTALINATADASLAGTLNHGWLGCTPFTQSNQQPLTTDGGQKRDIAPGFSCTTKEGLCGYDRSASHRTGTCCSLTTDGSGIPPLPTPPSGNPTANPTSVATWTPTATPNPTAQPTASGAVPTLPGPPSPPN